ncbi:ABC transporter ATP-binding protein [Frondihabitans cladoniiphilus]|uniref:ABC transporter domain-containing protein n=1 Tax=Frondihabitans cladoniiphilus TaxID=715785 RepID=A0ABP8W6J7_9MICO
MTTSRARVTITAQGVQRHYGSRAKRFAAVDDVSLAIDSTRALGIVGESGSGKSTLAKMLVGLEKPTAGTILLDGQDMTDMASRTEGMRELRRTVQMVAQDTSSSFDPRKTLREAVRRPAQLLRGLSQTDADAEVDELLALLDLDPKLTDRKPGQVSGGQRQRFSLARALVVRPRILVCDEVVSALDVSVQGTILNFVKDYCLEHDCGLVFVSHGLPATAFISDDMIVMYKGKIVENGLAEDVVTAPRHPYTKSLIEAYSTSEQSA